MAMSRFLSPNRCGLWLSRRDPAEHVKSLPALHLTRELSDILVPNRRRAGRFLGGEDSPGSQMQQSCRIAQVERGGGVVRCQQVVHLFGLEHLGCLRNAVLGFSDGMCLRVFVTVADNLNVKAAGCCPALGF